MAASRARASARSVWSNLSLKFCNSFPFPFLFRALPVWYPQWGVPLLFTLDQQMLRLVIYSLLLNCFHQANLVEFDHSHPKFHPKFEDNACRINHLKEEVKTN
uniref:(northern house mosquito) hypothetical protein n=1 Tax=Culex pipiens TaxID=7175 RepID=A0A8D8G895_CULPI